MFRTECDDFISVREKLCDAGDATDADLFGCFTGADLVAHDFDRFGWRPDEGDASLSDGTSKVGILREESVPGVDGVGPRFFDRIQNRLGVEVALSRGLAAQSEGVVGKSDMKRITVELGVDRNGLDSEFLARSNHSNGNLASIGDEDGRKRGWHWHIVWLVEMAATREVPGPNGTRFRVVEFVTATDSTNADLLDRAANGELPGVVRITDHQRRGRGRQGRTWFDQAASLNQPPSSLLMSTLLHMDPAVAPLVPLAKGLAVVEALGAEWGVELSLTWPNDVIVAGVDGVADRKLAGTLSEATLVSDPLNPGDQVLAVVVGTGVNLDFGATWRAEAPDDVKQRAIDLAEVAGVASINRDAVADAILRRLDTTLSEIESDVPSFLARYRTRCATIGRSVELDHPKGIVRGSAVDIDGSGALVIETSEGRQTFDAGEVHTNRKN